MVFANVSNVIPQDEPTILTFFDRIQLLCAYWRCFVASAGFFLCRGYCMVVQTRATYSNFHFLYNLSISVETVYSSTLREIMSISSPATELMSLNCPSLTLMDSSSAFSQQSEEASTSSTRVFSACIRLRFWSGEGTSFFSLWGVLEVLGILFLHSFPHRLCPFDYLLHYRYLFCWVHSLSFCYLPLHITMPRACIV